MKIVQQGNEKPKYLPITITLETAQEFIEVLHAFNVVVDSQILQSMKRYGDHSQAETYCGVVGILHEKMSEMKQQVKETL
jgi:hypothetical protein